MEGAPTTSLRAETPIPVNSVPHNANASKLGPLVSVIIPAYQSARLVAATLRSVQTQSMQEWECIVVDDGSTDDTADVVRPFLDQDSRIRLVKQANLGLSAARNTGLMNISPTTEYVAFLDSDDVWCEDALTELVKALEEDQNAVGSYGYAELIDLMGNPILQGVHPARQDNRRRAHRIAIRRVSASAPVAFDEWVVSGPLWPPAVGLHRRRTVDIVGLFDTELIQCEDMDFYTRMSRHGHYRPIGRQVAWYRQHPGQMTRRRAEFWYHHDMVRRKTWESALNTTEQRRSATLSWRVEKWRRIGHCSQRLLTSIRRRQWRDARRLVRGCILLIVQAMRPGPPKARREHIYWAGREAW
jgi:glycosyltransferase involved in cell wall biosynthesis